MDEKMTSLNFKYERVLSNINQVSVSDLNLLRSNIMDLTREIQIIQKS